MDSAFAAEQRGVPDSRLSILEAFYIATVGGADLLNVPAGLLAVGNRFDAVAVQVNRPGSPLQVWNDIDDEARQFEKIVRLATPADISNVWVDGRRVAGSS